MGTVTTTTSIRTTAEPGPDRRLVARVRTLVHDHRPFAVLLGLGLVVRAVVTVGFPPAFIFSDGPAYLAFVDELTVSPDRPVGYGVYVHVLGWLTRDVWLIAATQHLMGLAVAVILYTLMRRYGVGPWAAALGVVPVLFDSMQLVVEHSVLSDLLFELLLVGGIVVLAWRPAPNLMAVSLAGLALGLSVLVRLVAEPVVLAALVYVVLAATTWSRRLVASVALLACFAAPLAAYATWYHHERGIYAIAEISGRALYMRTTTFVDCGQLDLPVYEETLCPSQPLGAREDPTSYIWHDPFAVHALTPPPGMTPDEVARDFAWRAITAQPWDYAHIAARDFLLNFAPTRDNEFEYNTAYKWRFETYVDYRPTDWTGPAFAGHGGVQLRDHRPWSDIMTAYEKVVCLWGPLLLGCLVVAVAGLFRSRGDPNTVGARHLTLLLVLVGAGLMATPDLTAEFVWRYQLPALVLVPPAAVLAWTQLRRAQDGTRATPSTD